MKKIFPIIVICLFVTFRSQSQTTLTEDANGILDAGKLIIYTGVGQTFFTGHQNGSGYVNSAAIFSALTDNPNGSSNYFYDGQANGTRTFSIRADGQAYFAGNVGIGTASPDVLLHVVAPFSKTSTTVGYSNIASFLSTNDSSAPFGLRTMLYGGSTTANRYVTLQTTEYNVVDGGNIVLQPAAGSVGIGTANVPTGYLLAINGSGIATSFTVQSYANWPDYVFKSSYKLPSLSSVKTYINQNHHLPDVPSAEQVTKDGINLGEMDNIFTKKIEELTLYLIEKDKQLTDEKEINNQQQEQIDKQQQVNTQQFQQLKSQQKQINLLIKQVAQLSQKSK